MFPYRDSRITKIVLVVFFLFVLGYAYFEGRALLYGPRISVENRILQVSDPLIMIEGQADRISSLTLNGRSIPVTEEGDFSEPYALLPGYNRLILEARDRFGKISERTIEVVYTPEEADAVTTSADLMSATSSEQADAVDEE